MKYIVLDTETAGLPVRKGWDTYHNPKQFDKYYSQCRLVELAYVVYEDDVEILRYENIIIPSNFTIDNSQFHNITTEIATMKGRDLTEVLNQLSTDIEGCSSIVGHNINFDIHILLAEAHRTGNNKLVNLITKKKLFCTMTYGKVKMETYKSPKLTELYEFLYNKPLDQKHRALSDVMSIVDCYRKLV